MSCAGAGVCLVSHIGGLDASCLAKEASVSCCHVKEGCVPCVLPRTHRTRGGRFVIWRSCVCLLSHGGCVGVPCDQTTWGPGPNHVEEKWVPVVTTWYGEGISWVPAEPHSSLTATPTLSQHLSSP